MNTLSSQGLSSHSSNATDTIDTFAGQRAAIYETVVSSARFEEIRPFLRQLPLAITDFWGYELRLHDVEAAVDFLVCIGQHQAEALHESLSKGSMQYFKWQALLQLVGCWTDQQHDFHKKVRNIWLEMDASEMHKAQPAHNFFYAPDPSLSQQETLLLTKQILAMFDVRLGSSVWELFGHCQRSLSNQAIISQIGVMLARDKESLRFFVQGMDTFGLFTYLNNIGSSLDFQPLQTLMNELQPMVHTWGLNLELSKGGLRNAIGIECYLSPKDLEGFIDILGARSLLAPSIQTSLHEYAVQCSEATIEKYIEFAHHVKITYGPNASFAGKIYLGVKRNPLFFINTLRHIGALE